MFIVPFAFIFGGRESDDLLAAWPVKTEERPLDRARKQRVQTWSDPKTGLEVRCVAVDYSARDAIARTIEVKVTNMMKDFMQQSGVGQDAEALEFTSNVSKQVANTVLRGCKIIKREMKTEGSQYHGYSLAEYNLNSLVQETLNEARKQKALYNEAKANMSFEELEKEIEKLKSVGE